MTGRLEVAVKCSCVVSLIHYSSYTLIRLFIVIHRSSTVFSSVAMAVFVPLILEQLASEVGRVPGTETTPCSRPSNTAVGQDPPPCEVWFGPAGYVPTVSFALYITTIAVAFQTVTYISLGALADYGNNRKVFLVTFAVAGALLTISMLGVVNPQMYWLAAMLVIMANICYGIMVVANTVVTDTLHFNIINRLYAHFLQFLPPRTRPQPSGCARPR